MGSGTVRPNALVQVDAPWTPIGGASPSVNTAADDLDTTYWQGTGVVGPVMAFDVGTISIPALAQYRSVTARMRARVATGPGPFLTDGMTIEAGGVRGTYDQVSWTTTITTSTGAARTTTPAGAPWTQADIDAMRVVVRKSINLIEQDVYELYLDVLWNEAPAATATGPTGVQITSQPTLTHTYSDPEFDSQERLRWKVFSAAQYGAAGFDPETSAATWDSTELFTSQTSLLVTVPLPNNTTYRAYVKAADAGSTGRYGPWSFIGFSVAVDAPAAPVVTPTGDTANARVLLAVQGQDNLATANQSMVETGTVGFTPILNLTAGNIIRDTAQFAQGLSSLRIASTAAGDMKVGTLTGLNGFPAVAGQTYTGFVSIRPASARAVRAELAFYDAAGAQIGTNTLGASTSPGAGVWADNPGRTVSAVAPALTAFAAVIGTVLATGGAAEQAWFDKWGFFPGTPAAWSRGGFVLDPGRLADAFNRADNAASLATADVGGAWAALVGTWGTISNKAYLASATANAVAVLTSPVLSDGYMQADITLSATANRADAGFVFRAADASNYLFLELYKAGTGDGITVSKRVAGVNTLLQSVGPTGLINGATYTTRLEFYGATVRVLLNGVVKMSFIMTAGDLAAFGNNSKYGLFVNFLAGTGDDGGSRFDNFTVGNPKSQVARVQRSADAGVTWLDVREAYRKTLTDPVETGTFNDNEANRGLLLQYRARSEAAEGANSLVSLWSTPVTVTLANDGNSWLKSSTDPTLNRAVAALANMASEAPDDSTVLYPEGRKYPVIYTGPIRGEVFPLSLVFTNDAAWLAFETLRARGESLLFQTCYGDAAGDEQFWIKLGKRALARITSDGMAAAQARTAEVQAWEVAVPTVT